MPRDRAWLGLLRQSVKCPWARATAPACPLPGATRAAQARSARRGTPDAATGWHCARGRQSPAAAHRRRSGGGAGTDGRRPDSPPSARPPSSRVDAPTTSADPAAARAALVLPAAGGHPLAIYLARSRGPPHRGAAPSPFFNPLVTRLAAVDAAPPPGPRPAPHGRLATPHRGGYGCRRHRRRPCHPTACPRDGSSAARKRRRAAASQPAAAVAGNRPRAAPRRGGRREPPPTMAAA